MDHIKNQQLILQQLLDKQKSELNKRNKSKENVALQKKQENIINNLKQKLDKLITDNDTKKSKSVNKNINRIYVTESLDGSVELKPSKQIQPQSSQPLQPSQSQIQPQYSQQIEQQYPQQPQYPQQYPMQYPQQQPQQPMVDPVYIRDNQVLNDKLYPPLGRTERPQFDLLMNFINNQSGVFNMYTRGAPDTFRVLGYLTPKNGEQTIDSTLILYGRAKWQNSDIGDFYATSSSKISDIKIPLTQYNCNIRRIWDIPTEVEITGPMLGGKYDFTELPKPDLTHPYI
jgi:hypothetical protein